MTLAATPPMGWNSWNAFRTRIDQDQLLAMADALVESGMRDAGYRYLVVDDGWQAPARDAHGALQPDPERFSRGIAHLAQEIHDRGLHFGLYAVPGCQTCANIWDDYPGVGLGSYGHEQVDADTFAGWGVDYLKYDWCEAQRGTDLDRAEAFTRMRQCLDATGRDIVYSISEYGYGNPWEWAPGVAHLWRTTDDIEPTVSSISHIVDSQRGLEQYARPGAWNDPDMLQIGNGDLTPAQNRTHLALWAMLAAPLMAGNDLRVMSSEVRDLLVHPGMVALDQDPLGAQGRRVLRQYSCDLWTRSLSGDRTAHALVNRTSQPLRVEVTDDHLVVASPALGSVPPGEYRMPVQWTERPVDLWTGEPLHSLELAAHDTLVAIGSGPA